MEINKVYLGDTLEVLKQMPDEFVDCIITSPPYWGLRDYGIEGQIGLEPTLEEYLDNLFKITAELKRVLKKTGVLFWNHGDSYNANWRWGKERNEWHKQKRIKGEVAFMGKKGNVSKCLTLQNWRLILRMIDEQDWILRNTIIWHKPNAMPSSVKDRFTNKYEPIFMLVKNKKYWFDLDAVRVPHKVCGVTDKRPMGVLRQKLYPNSSYNKSNDPHLSQYKYNPDYYEKIIETRKEENPDNVWEIPYHPSGEPSTGHGMRRPPQPNQEGAFHPMGKNPSDLWSIPTQPCPKEFRGIHFAAFPEKLVEPMILSSCPPDTGIVLDPFTGTGTTLVMAKKLNRNYIGIELNPKYVEIIEKRLSYVADKLI